MPPLESAGWGLASAASWGAGDFAGGMATKRASVWRVVAFSQVVGGLLVAAVAFAVGDPFPSAAQLALAAAAGACGGVGILALYSALAGGRMGIAAPVTGVVSAVVPVSVGIALEGVPSPWALGGFALALLGLALVAGPTRERPHPRVMGLALLAGAGFGGFLVLFDRVEASLWWSLLAARVMTVGAMLVVLVAAAALRRRRGDAATPPAFPWAIAAAVGALDLAGNAFFVLAARAGRLDVAAVLSSLYPVVTALLARVVLKERLTLTQTAGAALMLAAIPLVVA